MLRSLDSKRALRTKALVSASNVQLYSQLMQLVLRNQEYIMQMVSPTLQD
jgi:hypothetical protein